MLTTPTPTPGSETSVYFDAPIVNFSSKENMLFGSKDKDKTAAATAEADAKDTTKPTGSILAGEGSRSPTVANGTPDKKTRVLPDANGTVPPASEQGSTRPAVVDDDNDDGYEDIDEEDEDHAIAHPNGSSGWLPATDLPGKGESSAGRRSSVFRNVSRRSNRPGSRTRSLNRAGSVGYAASTTSSVARRSLYTNSDGRVVNGSAFISGAGTTGPDAAAIPDDSLHRRRTSASAALSPKQNKKIEKREAADGKSLSRVIKQEARVEKKALNVVIQELADLQRMQKEAVKREAKAHAAHVKAVTAHHKAEEEYIAARVKYETTLAEMNAFGEALELARENARKTTESIQEKSQEVDALRTMYGVDEREREVKLTTLAPKKTSWFH